MRDVRADDARPASGAELEAQGRDGGPALIPVLRMPGAATKRPFARRPRKPGSRGVGAAVFERIGATAGGETILGTTGDGSGGPADPSSRGGIDDAVRRLRSAVMRVAAGSGQISEFTAARAELRKHRARSAASSTAPAGISVREALYAARSGDRDLARRAVIALIAKVTAGPDTVEVRLRFESSALPSV